MLIGHIVADALITVVGLFVIARHLSVTSIFERTPSDFPRNELLNFNHLSIVYILLLTSLYHVDVLMLKWFTTTEEVGYYKAALVLAEFLWLAPKAIESVMLQSTANLWHDRRIGRINALSSKVTRYTLLFCILLAVGVGALAPRFVPVYYGAEFVPAVVPLLLPGTVGFAMARPILAISHANGNMRVMIAATGTAAGLNLMLNTTLIPIYGVEGAAVATSIGYASLPLVHIWGAQSIGYHPLSDLRPIRIAVTTVSGGAFIAGLSIAIESTLVAMLVVPPVGFVAYTAITLASGAVRFDELLQVLNGLPGPIGQQAAVLRRHRP